MVMGVQAKRVAERNRGDASGGNDAGEMFEALPELAVGGQDGLRDRRICGRSW